MKHDQIHAKKEYRDIRELIERSAEEFGGKVAYSFRKNPHKKETTRITFHRLRDDVRALSAKLIQMNACGKHIVLVGALSYEWALVYFASLSVGAVLVPLDRDWLADDLADTAQKPMVPFSFVKKSLPKKQTRSPKTHVSARLP